MEPYKLKLKELKGSGRAVFLLSQFQKEKEQLQAAFQALAEEAQVFWFEQQSPGGRDWNVLACEVAQRAKEYGLWQISLIDFGGMVDLLLAIFLLDPKLLRLAALIEPEVAQTKSLLHRIRCPVLIITTSQSPMATQTEAQYLAKAIPTAWHVTVAKRDTTGMDLMLDLLRRFIRIPAKCPQRRSVSCNTA